MTACLLMPLNCCLCAPSWLASRFCQRWGRAWASRPRARLSRGTVIAYERKSCLQALNREACVERSAWHALQVRCCLSK